jgi:hypothetical protein
LKTAGSETYLRKLYKNCLFEVPKINKSFNQEINRDFPLKTDQLVNSTKTLLKDLKNLQNRRNDNNYLLKGLRF